MSKKILFAFAAARHGTEGDIYNEKSEGKRKRRRFETMKTAICVGTMEENVERVCLCVGEDQNTIKKIYINEAGVNTE